MNTIINKSQAAASEVLEPLEALEVAMTASSIDDAWQKMGGKFEKAGFTSCALAIARRSVEAPIGHPDTRFWGSFVSERFQEVMAALPAVQKSSPPLMQLRSTARPIAFFGDSEEFRSSNPDISKYNEIISGFGIKGRAIIPFHAPASDCLMAIGWWNFESAEESKALWAKLGGLFSLSATYFCQGILDNFTPLAQPTEALSSRERECLLWVATGKRTGEIAQLLNLADATVNEYLTRAMKKLGARTRSEACAKAVIMGILTP